MVGALSIPMMLIQTPGSFVFVYTLASREGTNWTTWITYLVSGCLQGVLLSLCILWHRREQERIKMLTSASEDVIDGEATSSDDNNSNAGDPAPVIEGQAVTATVTDTTVDDNPQVNEPTEDQPLLHT
ncbi:hypothetical protein BDF19DRAFT_234775 [Syncephalis fuscata]|nr:hypothetical protein BDF19DRAFT_234775 [Syncephalis fuscata]